MNLQDSRKLRRLTFYLALYWLPALIGLIHPSPFQALLSLGLLPGGGGVTRVVRLLGLQQGLMDVLLPGTRFKAAQAKEKGLVDELVASQDDLLPAARAWLAANADIADAVAYLLGARFVTGQILAVDGGRSLND